MTVPEGHFRIYPSMRPHLTAGQYRFRTTQDLRAVAADGTARDASQLPVESLDTHVEVTSPRYLLPPDQILSTYPPAGSEGAYGSRLPQIVIKRRTLPWERDVVPGTPGETPWLALVVLAEGEAELVLGASAGECVTPGLTLPGAADVSTANYLAIRRSVIDDVLPTRKDVPLLAHVREVDISDTELMMGDDDGFVAVVVANRLPLAGRTPEGEEAPVKYLAALINLEGQLDVLLPEAPEVAEFTSDLLAHVRRAMPAADLDVHLMRGGDDVISPTDLVSGILGSAHPAGSEIRPRATSRTVHESVVLAPDATATAYSSAGGWPTERILDTATVSAELSKDFVHAVAGALFDPTYRFPVLAHWSFTSVGDTTFESLMTGLHSGLLGTPSPHPAPEGRPPLTVVETGHVELPHRTRHGDLTAAWYRGPLSPHPTDVEAPRLPLAHAADQLRIVVPDGREDLSLASAFEIGRLMALSHPSIVDALLRWRQTHFQAVRGRSLLRAEHGLDLDGILELRDLPREIGRRVVEPLVARPELVIGDPLELRPAGTPMRITEALELAGELPEVIAAGLAVEVDLSAGVGPALETLHAQPVRLVTDLAPRVEGALTGVALHETLAETATAFAASTLGTEVVSQWLGGEVAWDGIDAEVVLDRLVDRGRIDVGDTWRGVDATVRLRPRDALDDLIADEESDR